jgi:hypothetical protein
MHLRTFANGESLIGENLIGEIRESLEFYLRVSIIYKISYDYSFDLSQGSILR